jgi:hypothetical protein
VVQAERGWCPPPCRRLRLRLVGGARGVGSGQRGGGRDEAEALAATDDDRRGGGGGRGRLICFGNLAGAGAGTDVAAHAGAAVVALLSTSRAPGT